MNDFVAVRAAAEEMYYHAPHPRHLTFYRTFLSILANDPTHEPMGDRALAVLEEMKSDTTTTATTSGNQSNGNDDNATTDYKLVPDLLCYNLVLKALAKEGNYDAATQILQSMLQGTEELQDDPPPPPSSSSSSAADTNENGNNKNSKKNKYITTPNLVISFHTVLKALYEAKSLQAAEQAEQVLEIMWKVANLQRRPDYEPTSRTYATVIGIWTQLGQPQRAMTLLEEVQNLYKQNKYANEKFMPDRICYRNVIGSLAKQAEYYAKLQKKQEMLQSKTRRLNNNNNHGNDSIQNNYGNDDDENNNGMDLNSIAEQATLVLRNMFDIGHDINTLTMNSVLKCWAMAGQPREAERLLEEVTKSWGLQADIISYNTIITAYSRQGNADRAREILDQLLMNRKRNNDTQKKSRRRNNNNNDPPRPNTVTFTAVISALSKKRTVAAAELAERLLLQMQELYEDHGEDTRPNMMTYNSLLNCWANVPSDGAGPRAELILRGMQENLPSKEQPNVISYNTVLQAYSPDLEKAELLLQDMISRGIAPTDSTVNTIMAMVYRNESIQDKETKANQLTRDYFQNVLGQNRRNRHETRKRRYQQQRQHQ